MPPMPCPWTERYRPKHLGEVIGNTDQVRKLAEWLRDWDDVVLKGNNKEQKKPEAWQKFAPAPENINARAALVSGPPGIGKTTTCVLVAKCNPSYKLMEFNASDARGKTIIENMSSSLAGNHTIKFGKAGESCIERAVIIMDECDGMTGGDAGGLQAMKQMIKTTKNPIICICNDRSHQGIRDLAGSCLDIKFKKPENAAVAKRIKRVMEGEGKNVDLRTIEAVVEACGQDIRQIINQSQFFGSVSVQGKESQKDAQVMLSSWDACEQLLKKKGSKLPTMEKRMDMYYLDSEMMPLMVHENYLRTYEKRVRNQDDVESCAKAAELMAMGDQMSGNWEVGGSAAILSTIYPAFLTADESFQRPMFPSWLQKRGSTSKANRLIHEMYSKVRCTTTCASREFATSSYHDMLYQKLLKPLQYGAVKECAVALHGVGLNREFFTDQAPAIRGPLGLEDPYKKVEGRIKSQLYQELQAIAQEATDLVKRKRVDQGGGGSSKRRSTGGDGEDEGNGGGKGVKKKTKKDAGGSGAASLSGWRPTKLNADGTVDMGRQKGNMLIWKFLDGHTCAVRRRIHMRDVLEPWLVF